jgi:hypothetical protein
MLVILTAEYGDHATALISDIVVPMTLTDAMRLNQTDVERLLDLDRLLEALAGGFRSRYSAALVHNPAKLAALLLKRLPSRM